MNRLDDLAFVQRWFRHRLPGAPVVRQVRRLSRGVSRQTWTIDTDAGSYVVRRDHENGSIVPTALRAEYEVYRRLRDTPVPVTDALWFEDDPEWQPDGRAAYVRTKVDGDWRVLTPDLPAAVRIALAKEHLDKLALVHTLDWERLGFGELFAVPPSPGRCAATLIDTCLAQLAEFGAEPSPVLAESVAWLRDEAPESPVVRLCKGTNGHGEEVWSGGRIVAMSDWELAAIGDPAYDFAQLQEMVPEGGDWSWPEALRYYEDRTGIRVTMARIEYYRRCYGLLQYVYTQHAAARVRAAEVPDLRFVWNAAEVGYRSQLRLAKVFGAMAPR